MKRKSIRDFIVKINFNINNERIFKSDSRVKWNRKKFWINGVHLNRFKKSKEDLNIIEGSFIYIEEDVQKIFFKISEEEFHCIMDELNITYALNVV